MALRRRIEHPNHIRFMTFSCYQRLPFFSNRKIADKFAGHLADTRARMGFHLIAWVIMPEHVHILVWPKLSEHEGVDILRAIKQPFAGHVLRRWRETDAAILKRIVDSRGAHRFWQRGGGYDRNIFSEHELTEKLQYIHNNPVSRGLCSRPEDWRWSSRRWYFGVRTGEIAMDPVRRP